MKTIGKPHESTKWQEFHFTALLSIQTGVKPHRWNVLVVNPSRKDIYFETIDFNSRKTYFSIVMVQQGKRKFGLT